MTNSILATSILFLQFVFSESGCAPMRYDIAFYLVGRKAAVPNQKIFTETIVSNLSIGYMQTRVSCHLYSSDQKQIFDFKSKTTQSGIVAGLETIVGDTNKPDTITAFSYINSIFTENNGDRPDVPNICLMIAINEDNDTYTHVSIPSTIELWVIDAQNSYTYDDYYSDYKYSTFSTVYKTLSARIQYALTELNDIASTFTAQKITCNYNCDVNYFTYDEPENLNSGYDTESGKITLLMDSAWDITCCGVVSSWIFYTKASGTIKIGVFRPNGTNHYVLVGFNTIIIPDQYVDTLVDYQVLTVERIAIIEGDRIGWYTEGPNIISYSDCNLDSRTDCPQSTQQFSPLFDIQDGVHFDIPSDSNTITNRAYSLKFTTANNTEMYIRTNENETELEENTAIGKHAIFMTVEDSDYENHTFDIDGDPESLKYLELNTAKMTLDLKAKFPKGGGGPYVVTVSGNDTCQHSATVTLTVSTYNAPPVINNLPHILEILETTKTSVPLIQINVTDATNDDICCTLPFTLPNTFNFKLVTTPVENGTDIYWLYTIDEPAFEYSDIDSFRVFVCCQDAYGSSYSYLILRLVEVKQEVPYTPPAWFFRALYLSLAPISVMTLVACFTLLYSVFWL